MSRGYCICGHVPAEDEHDCIKVGDMLPAEYIPGWGITEVHVEAVDEDGVIWVSTRDGEEWELMS